MKELREYLVSLFETVLPAFYIANDDPQKAYKLSDIDDHNFIVLVYDHQEPSGTNSLGSFRFWKVHVYVEGGSLVPIDDFVEQVEKVFKQNDMDYTLAVTGDYYDSLVGKYRNTLEFKTPRGGY